MNKLIELLKLKDWYNHIIWKKQSDWWYMFWLDDMACREERLLGKKFWFIKRLVDNDKIDLEEYKNESGLYTLKVIYWTDHYIDLLTNKVNSDFLLMLLSISDTPIEDLISYLR